MRFHVAFNEIPEEFVSNSTVYFLRDTKGMCPEELQPQNFQFSIKQDFLLRKYDRDWDSG